jgi:hypothetical protein
MIQTTIIPNKCKVSFTIPNNYIGKKVYALIYIDEEITEVVEALPTQKPSDFFGTLSHEEGIKMHLHALETRKEWNRDI